MDNIFNIVMPHGAFGASDEDGVLETFMRELAVKAQSDPNEWAEKYGTNFENGTFMMHRYCWCQQDGCPWCVTSDMPMHRIMNQSASDSAPHFKYKPLGFEVRWYKYIGRGMEWSRELTKEEFEAMKAACFSSLKDASDKSDHESTR